MRDRKMKAVTFSYDDGTIQDIRLIKMLDRYGLKATFNINSWLLGIENTLVCEGIQIAHIRNKRDEISDIYQKHEIASYTLTHPRLPVHTDFEIIRQIEQDWEALSKLASYQVVGIAYPGGGINTDKRVASLVINHTGIQYARTIMSTLSFSFPADLFQINPTIYPHRDGFDTLLSLAEKFISLEPCSPQVFYIWRHSFEFEITDAFWTV